MKITEERIVYVNEDGTPTGETAPKLAAHNAHTKFHFGFSCYVFNERGDFLVTQRALSKKVWPGVWTNTVCGHPAPGEDIVEAIKRRLQYELGMTAEDYQVVLPSYRYTTPPFNGVIENEFCPVFVARMSSEPNPNPEEVEAYKWLPWNDYVTDAEADPGDVYSYWCKDQLKVLKDQPLIKEYSKT